MSTELLTILLIALVFVSGFFSGSETGMMALNRYRVRHLARKKNRSAKRVETLLKRPDRLLGIILIGNTFANIFASSIATVIAVRLVGDIGIPLASVLLTFVILIFAEMTPKTLAALHPQAVAFPASFILQGLLNILYPIVWIANMFANGILKLFRVKVVRRPIDTLTNEELRTVVHEATSRVSQDYQDMLLGVLDLNKVTVDDIMVPRSDIVGVNLEDSMERIIDQLMHSQHTKLPIFRESIDKVEGVLHMRDALHLIAQDNLSKESMVQVMMDVYFIPEMTALNVQLINFQQAKQRTGMVVDEYGDIQGLVTLEDILEEIVGEFTTGLTSLGQQVQYAKGGTYLVDGSVNVRELNRMMSWSLPTDGPKTLSGVIVEHLQALPKVNVGLRLAGYPIEIVAVKGKTVKIARVYPNLFVSPEETL